MSQVGHTDVQDVEPMLYQSDRDGGLEVLRKLGYNTDEDVHEQFMKRMKEKYGDTSL